MTSLPQPKPRARSRGLVQNARSGTCYDRKRDLSFKFMADNNGYNICWMVVGPGSEAQSVLLFPIIAAGLENVKFDPKKQVAQAPWPTAPPSARNEVLFRKALTGRFFTF